MTEERQPNTEPPYAPTPKCPLGDHLVFVWPDSGKIVPHYGADGLKCPASYTVHPNVTTKPEAHGPVSERFMRHHYGASGFVEKEPNTELRDKAREFHRIIAANQIEELKRERDEWKRVYKKKDETLESLSAAYDELEDKSEKQLAEARAQAFREAADAIPAVGEMPKHVHPGFCPICDKFYARKAALEECAAAIHNRFCGENGEPCQVCRLKAEREEK